MLFIFPHISSSLDILFFSFSFLRLDFVFIFFLRLFWLILFIMPDISDAMMPSFLPLFISSILSLLHSSDISFFRPSLFLRFPLLLLLFFDFEMIFSFDASFLRLYLFSPMASCLLPLFSCFMLFASRLFSAASYFYFFPCFRLPSRFRYNGLSAPSSYFLWVAFYFSLLSFFAFPALLIFRLFFDAFIFASFYFFMLIFLSSWLLLFILALYYFSFLRWWFYFRFRRFFAYFHILSSFIILHYCLMLRALSYFLQRLLHLRCLSFARYFFSSFFWFPDYIFAISFALMLFHFIMPHYFFAIFRFDFFPSFILIRMPFLLFFDFCRLLTLSFRYLVFALWYFFFLRLLFLLRFQSQIFQLIILWWFSHAFQIFFYYFFFAFTRLFSAIFLCRYAMMPFSSFSSFLPRYWFRRRYIFTPSPFFDYFSFDLPFELYYFLSSSEHTLLIIMLSCLHCLLR